MSQVSTFDVVAVKAHARFGVAELRCVLMMVLNSHILQSLTHSVPRGEALRENAAPPISCFLILIHIMALCVYCRLSKQYLISLWVFLVCLYSL